MYLPPVLAGAGADIVTAGAGEDWVEGGSEADILGGNAGADSIYAESTNGGTLSLNQAIAQGETREARAGQGDLLSGDGGDDILISDAGSDFIAGGEGKEIIVGGAGDDVIYGDQSVTSATLGWAVTRSRNDSGGTAIFTVDKRRHDHRCAFRRWRR